MTKFTTDGQRDVFKGTFKAVGAASERMENVREAFGKHFARASGFAATKAAHCDSQESRNS